MNAKHTPGPWETSVFQSCGEVDAWDVCAAGGGDMLADLKGNPNGEADANLMAAAPDLLAALELARARLYRHAMENKEAIDAADAALTKARGEG